jgi:fructose-1,6-bisphosphatase/inositol monophosphatase family enzyme
MSSHPSFGPLTLAQVHEALDAAVAAAREAGCIVRECATRMQHAGGKDAALTIDTKSSCVDLVTEYDKRCEALIIAKLRAFRPSAAVGPAPALSLFSTPKPTAVVAKAFDFLSEESLPDAPIGDGPTWVIDPIDGTTSFAHGLADCGVSIALAVNRVPILGVVHAPLADELFTAVRGCGAFLNGVRINGGAAKQAAAKAGGIKTVRGSVISFHSPSNRSAAAVGACMNITRDMLLRDCHAVRAYGACAIDMCWVGCGRLDLYFEVGINAWDVAAGLVVAEEAGRVVTTIHAADAAAASKAGASYVLRNGKLSIVAAASRELAKEAIELSLKHNYIHNMLHTKKDSKL